MTPAGSEYIDAGETLKDRMHADPQLRSFENELRRRIQLNTAVLEVI